MTTDSMLEVFKVRNYFLSQYASSPICSSSWQMITDSYIEPWLALSCLRIRDHQHEYQGSPRASVFCILIIEQSLMALEAMSADGELFAMCTVVYCIHCVAKICATFYFLNNFEKHWLIFLYSFWHSALQRNLT